MTTNFVSVDEFKSEAPDVDLSRYSDTTISGILTTATKRAEQFVNYSFPHETVTEKIESHVDPDGDLIIFPTKQPVRTLVSVSVVKAGFDASLTLTSGSDNLYDITDDNRIVIPGSSISLNTVSVIDFNALRSVKFFCNVTYTAGYYMYDRPKDIIDAVILYARDCFARTMNSSGATSVSQGAVSIQYSQRTGKSDLEKDAERILMSYKRVAGF